MLFELLPREGAGDIRLNSTRGAVRALLDSLQCATRDREPKSDFYEPEGIILGYDALDLLEFIEITHPSTAFFRDIYLFNSSLPEVVAKMKAHGGSVPFLDGSYNYESLGLIIYCPLGALESVAIYRDGYYDDP